MAQWLHAQGLQAGDRFAVLLENRVEILALAARQAGLYAAVLSTHLTPAEVAYIVLDCGARLLVASRKTLALIERYRVTHSQWVPTMFGRMLRVSEEVRRRYDLSSHRMALHAAVPCPVDAKRAMLDWWGDILMEYYAGSEGCGTTMINSNEWRQRPGSVGRPHPDFGEVPLAAVVLRPGAEVLARMKLPQRVVFVDALPRPETGKLLRRKLKERFRDGPQAGFVLRHS